MTEDVAHNNDLDDVLGAISDLATFIDKRFEQVDSRFEQVDSRFEQVDKRFEQIDRRFDEVAGEFRKVHAEITELREWLKHLDDRVGGIESDIEEIYDRIVILEQRAPQLTKAEQTELSRKFDALFEWAKLVSKKTGVALPKL